MQSQIRPVDRKKMPSAKSHRSQVAKAARNKTVRSFTRSRVTNARSKVTEDGTTDETTTAVKQAISALDRAARKGVIHPNQAARKKSRLQRSLNSASSS